MLSSRHHFKLVYLSINLFIYLLVCRPPPPPATSTAYAGSLVGHLITTTLSFKRPLPVALRHEYIYISHLPMIVLLWLLLLLVVFSLFIFFSSLVFLFLIYLFYLLLFLMLLCWLTGFTFTLKLVHHVIFDTCDVIGFRFKHHCQR